MAAPIRVAVVGATGRTGQSIVNGLLASDGKFEVTALTRPAAIDSAANRALKDRGVHVVLADLLGPHEELVKVLRGINVVVSAIVYDRQNDQIPLIKAAKEAGVGRYVPGFWGTPAPRGRMRMFDQKLDILAEVQRQHLPYTVIDVGWWTQQILFRLPSGRTNHGAFEIFQFIPGEGDVPVAITDIRDIGRYVAEIITDPRTLNKSVFAYTEVMTLNEMVKLQERIGGEKIEVPRRSIEDIYKNIKTAAEALEVNPDDRAARLQLIWHQYLDSWGVKGDNTPEIATYLGYLDFKDLRPDVHGKTLEAVFSEVLAGGDSGVKDPLPPTVSEFAPGA